MSIKTADQISIVDVTDAYSVILTSDAYTFPGTTSAAIAGSCQTQIIAMRGAEIMPAGVVLSEITKPDGVTVTKDASTTSPTLTISVTTSVTSAGIVGIPVHIGDITIHKDFAFAIAFTGATGSAGKGIRTTAITYQAAASGTVIPTGSWTDTVPSVSAGQFLWTRTVITYTDNSTTTGYSVGRSGTNGTNGTSVTITSREIMYAASSNGTTIPTSGWQAAIPSVSAGQYLWTRTTVNYSNSTSTVAYSVGRNGTNGANGAPGADAITMTITSSNGTIFKNSAIETILTAHVYRAGTELTAAQITPLGVVKWYKDGGTTAVATGLTLTIDAGDVTNRATYVAQLEG